MERLKVVSLAVIALVLSVRLVMDLVPEAQAETSIRCNAWRKEMIGGFKGEAKAEGEAIAFGNEVAAWMMANPGDPVFRTTLVQGAGAAWIDIVCVR